MKFVCFVTIFLVLFKLLSKNWMHYKTRFFNQNIQRWLTGGFFFLCFFFFFFIKTIQAEKKSSPFCSQMYISAVTHEHISIYRGDTTELSQASVSGNLWTTHNIPHHSEMCPVKILCFCFCVREFHHVSVWLVHTRLVQSNFAYFELLWEHRGSYSYERHKLVLFI